jgi:DedD protein
MAGGGKRGGDRILESRHLVGLFLGVVLLCGVFFTLGYVMGRNQYEGAVHAEEARDDGDVPVRPAAKPKPAAEAPPTPASNPGTNNEWDFYTKRDNDHLEPDAKLTKSAPPAPDADSSETPAPAAPAPVPVSSKAAGAPGNFAPPRLGRNSIVLQISATRHKGDAFAMADAIQQKHFPCFVVAPAGDTFYRVQVGPYHDEKSAEAARSALERAGFKAIIKH